MRLYARMNHKYPLHLGSSWEERRVPIPGVPFVGLPVLDELCTIHKMSEARNQFQTFLLGGKGCWENKVLNLCPALVGNSQVGLTP